MQHQTVYAFLPAWAARAILALIVVLVALPAIPHTPLKIPGERQHWWEAPKGYTDDELYRDILFDMERGEGYYKAAAQEQRAHSYPTAPPQVFREPTLAFALEILHFRVLRFALLYAIYAAIFITLYRELVRANVSFYFRIAAVAAAVSGLSIAGMTGAIYIHEVWTALLLAASLLIYRADRWWFSLALGLLACFVREIALPYLVVMGAFALLARRWKEGTAWFAAIAGFLFVYSFHLAEAAKVHAPGDLVSQGWLGLGGWNFVIATAKWNVVLHALPAPLIALAICLGVLGLAGTQEERARRAVVVIAGYLCAFLLVGRLDNYYWGILYTPLLPLGVVLSPAALRDLFRRAGLVRAPAMQ